MHCVDEHREKSDGLNCGTIKSLREYILNWVLNGVRWKNESKKDTVLDNGPSQHKQIPQGDRSPWSSKVIKKSHPTGGYLVGEGKEACLERVRADYTGFWVLI